MCNFSKDVPRKENTESAHHIHVQFDSCWLFSCIYPVGLLERALKQGKDP
jgi:hypothetical protein